MGAELAIMIASAINFGILRWKFGRGRYFDVVLDVLCLITLSVLFGGTLGGMTIAMGAGAMISFYLLVSQPKFNFSFPKISWFKVFIWILAILTIATWTMVLVHFI